MVRSLKSKFILIMSGLILLLIFGSSIVSYNQSKMVLEETIMDAAARGAEQNAKIITNWLLATTNELTALSKTPAVRSMKWSEQQAVLEATIDTHSNYDGMYIVNKNGMGTFSNGEKADLSDRDYVKMVLQTGSTYISDPIISRITGNRIIAIAQPIYDQKGGTKPTGIIAATVRLDYLQNIVKEMKLCGYGYGWIISSDMTTIAHPNAEYIGNKDIFNGNKQLEVAASKMAEGKKAIVRYKLDGIAKEMAFAPIKLTGWSIAMTAETDDVFAPLNQMRSSGLIIAIISILIGVIVAYFIAVSIVKPIKNFQELFAQMAAGDLTVSYSHKNVNCSEIMGCDQAECPDYGKDNVICWLDVGSYASEFDGEVHCPKINNGVYKTCEECKVYKKVNTNEIETMGVWFNKLVKNLRDMVSSISKISDQVAGSSEELSASGEQVGDAAEQVSSAIQDVSSKAEEQSARIEDTNGNMNNLINHITKVDQSTRELTRDAMSVTDKIEMGTGEVRNTINKTKSMKEKTENVADTVDSLGKLSEEIGTIVQMINGISAQTNLLALNAAIEAARAGEAGRGFSVVADEIRELAAESAEATESISSLINRIQEGVKDTVEQMNKSVELVDDNVKSAQQTGSIFDEIEELTSKLRNQLKDISNNVNEMSADSAAVENAMADITVVSQEFAGNAEEVAASSEEQNAATEEIITASVELAEMAGQLAETIKQFKI